MAPSQGEAMKLENKIKKRGAKRFLQDNSPQHQGIAWRLGAKVVSLKSLQKISPRIAFGDHYHKSHSAKLISNVTDKLSQLGMLFLLM
jgi:hypothetical protein